MEELGKLIGDVSSPGDLATVLLAGTVGFVIDAGLSVFGFLSPGQTGILAASSALGIKKAWQASRAQRWPDTPMQRAFRLRDFVGERRHQLGSGPAAARLFEFEETLDREIQLLGSGVIDEATAVERVDAIAEQALAVLAR
jgi:hypothetical protein